jgi:hypothetical protein
MLDLEAVERRAHRLFVVGAPRARHVSVPLADWEALIAEVRRLREVETTVANLERALAEQEEITLVWQAAAGLDQTLRASKAEAEVQRLREVERERDELRERLNALGQPSAYAGSQTSTAPLEPTALWLDGPTRWGPV